MSLMQAMDSTRETPLPGAATASMEFAPRYGTSRLGWRDASRHKGLILTVLVYVLPAAFMLIRWQAAVPAPPPPTLATFNVAPAAAPQEAVREVPPGPEQVKTAQPIAKPPAPEIALSPTAIPASPPQPVEEVAEPPKPAPPVEKTTAPETRPAPPAQQASDEKATWEGQVLAALNKGKRYPREAQFRRQQGVPYIRFVIDRAGRVLSSTLERSSGVRSLDDEAVAMPKRAQPLPKPPESRKGATIELVVPVEFFLGR